MHYAYGLNMYMYTIHMLQLHVLGRCLLFALTDIEFT